MPKMFDSKVWYQKELENSIRKLSHGKIKKAERRVLSSELVNKIDFNNPFHMRRSISSYAKVIVERQEEKKCCKNTTYGIK